MDANSKSLRPGLIARLFSDEPARDLGDFTATRRMIPVALVAIGIGVLSGYVARGLLALIACFTNIFFFGRISLDPVTPAEHHLGYFVIVIPVIGALLIGLMARYGSDRIRGHGIPEALEAILIRGSRVAPRVAIWKPLSSAVSIGSGGPFGAEGPIIMTGGAVGSLVAQTLHLTNAERKTLLVAGAAGGMTATFGTPLAAAMLAVELLLFEWKPRSFVPVVLACIAAMATRQALFPPGPLFEVPAHMAFVGVRGLLGCAVLGALAGALSAAMTASVYFFEDVFQKRLSALHWMWWPALAGVVIGVGGLIAPRALGVGYDSIAELLTGRMALGATLVLILVKWTIWSVALGSGTSGGVLAPLLMLGAALGSLCSPALPEIGPGFWPLIGMAATLGGTMRSPITAIFFALEVTHDWDAILPLAAAVMIAHSFTVLVLRRSILTEKVSRRGFHVTREYAVDPLEVLFAHEVMRPCAELLAGAPAELRVHPDQTLRTVTHQMAHSGITRAVVVRRGEPREVLGELTLEDVLTARRRHLEEETRRQRVLPLHALVGAWWRPGVKSQ
jgi:H+/Cl- antiporter ClcA